MHEHILENAFIPTLRPKGALTPPLDIYPLFAEYIQYQYIDSNDWFAGAQFA